VSARAGFAWRPAAPLDRKGNAVTLKLKGTVEPYFKDVARAQD
jgi:hypothetical protein